MPNFLVMSMIRYPQAAVSLAAPARLFPAARSCSPVGQEAVLYPLLLLVLYSFQLDVPGQPIRFGLEGWITAFSEPAMGRAIWNTATLSLARTGIALPIGIFLAWLLARTDLPGRNWLEFVFWISFFLPSSPNRMGCPGTSN